MHIVIQNIKYIYVSVQSCSVEAEESDSDFYRLWSVVCGLWMHVWQIKEFTVRCGTKLCSRWQSSAA